MGLLGRLGQDSLTGVQASLSDERETAQNGRLDVGPGMHHHRVVEPERLIPLRGGCGIPSKVLVTQRLTVVVLSPVDFEDDAAGEKEVDAPHALDPHLGLEGDAEAVQPQPQKGLESAVGRRTGDVDEPPHTRAEAEPDLPSVGARQQSSVPGRLEGCEEGLGAQAARDLHEGVHERHRAECRPADVAMRHAPTTTVMDASTGADPDMAPRARFENPDPVSAQRRRTAQLSPMLGGGVHRRIDLWQRVDAITDAHQGFAGDSPTQGLACDTLPTEVAPTRDAAGSTD